MQIVNAGVSGDTSAGGLARVDWLLSLHPEVLVVALGANDGLRGQPVAAIEANLRQIVRRARAAGARVVLAGMKMPPNYGPDYTRDFAALYARLARELELPFIPFLLEGVAADPPLNQADGIHPTAEGQRKIADLVAPVLLRLREPAGADGRNRPVVGERAKQLAADRGRGEPRAPVGGDRLRLAAPVVPGGELVGEGVRQGGRRAVAGERSEAPPAIIPARFGIGTETSVAPSASASVAAWGPVSQREENERHAARRQRLGDHDAGS